MPGTVAIALIVLAVIALVVWMARNDVLIRLAGADPAFIRTVPDRARYTSMGAIVVAHRDRRGGVADDRAVAGVPGARLAALPAGRRRCGALIVFSFDRWIVASLDYGPLTAGRCSASAAQAVASKVVHFGVRFVLAALVGVVISEPIVLTVFGPEIRQQLTVQHTADVTTQTAQINAAEAKQAALLQQPVTAAQQALTAATRKANRAHKIYICEITGNCHLGQGQVTGVIGQGPQSRATAPRGRPTCASSAGPRPCSTRPPRTSGSAAAALKRQSGRRSPRPPRRSTPTTGCWPGNGRWAR